ncbi:helix-turn-helix domain-containing protein [Bryocella elongata]|nr:helix-turn-helix transcriptional regulator [Bryocella elongata]
MANAEGPWPAAVQPQLPIGEVLRARRLELRMSQAQAAGRADVEQANYARYEQDALCPQMGTLLRLAYALRLPASQILERAEDLQRHRGRQLDARKVLGDLLRGGE